MSTKESATDAYNQQVRAIVDGPHAGDYRPAQPVELFITNRRVPTNIDGLTAAEQLELERMWRGWDLARLLATGITQDDDAYPLDLEIADVITNSGELLYRIHGMNYGGMYLMRADRLECVAFASQHSVEIWRPEQRDLFWAMDRALGRGGHGFRQPIYFGGWADEKRWADLATVRPSAFNEACVRAQFEEPAET